ncbi:MAG: YkgJ family cysteine cluster protein [Candidatus Sumerlaeaceae bacterium]|nr:YkgJ family cysteine cluster protein [Candidatus Sumerlaeaceae bacterium]
MTFSDPISEVPTKGSEPLRVVVPPNARFTCHSCGLCCRVFPRIVVDPTRVEHITQNLAALGEFLDQPLLATDTIRAEENGEYVLGRQENGACVFLSRENKCAIHAVLGEFWKPQTCRDFPFVFRQAHAEVFVGLSFACPTVRHNEGELLETSRAALGKQSSQAFRCDKISRDVTFDSRYCLSWESYLEVEQALRDILEEKSVELPTRLVAMHVLLGMLRLWLEARCPPKVEAGVPQMTKDNDVSAFIEANRRTNFREPFRIAQSKRGQPSVRRTFLSLVLGCAASMWKHGKPLEASLGILRNYIAALCRLGSLEIPPLPGRYPRSVLDHTLDFANQQSQELIWRYAAHCLWRKDLAVGVHGVRRAFELLLLRIGLLPVYAGALKSAQRVPEDDALSQSVGLVEIYFGHHSDLFFVIDATPRLATVLDSFFVRKNYPDIILGRVK